MDTGLGADEPPKSSIEPNSLPKAPLPFTWFEAPAYPPCGALSWYTGMEGGRASNTVENFTFCYEQDGIATIDLQPRVLEVAALRSR